MEVPPVPIPNTEVKLQRAKGTWLETARETRSPPDSTGGVHNSGRLLFLRALRETAPRGAAAGRACARDAAARQDACRVLRACCREVCRVLRACCRAARRVLRACAEMRAEVLRPCFREVRRVLPGRRRRTAARRARHEKGAWESAPEAGLERAGPNRPGPNRPKARFRRPACVETVRLDRICARLAQKKSSEKSFSDDLWWCLRDLNPYVV